LKNVEQQQVTNKELLDSGMKLFGEENQTATPLLSPHKKAREQIKMNNTTACFDIARQRF